MKLLSLILILFLLTISRIYADNLEDALGGFEDGSANDKPITAVVDIIAEKDSRYRFSGYMSLLTAYNYAQKSQSIVAPGDMLMDFSGLSRTRTKLDLAADIKHSFNWKSRIEVMVWYDAAWTINGRDNYSNDILNSYESYADIKEAYIQGSLTESLDLKIGRQLVIWGKSDSIRITDIINPLDNREPGMVDIKDLRLSETMTKFDYYFGDFGLSAIVIHEPRLEIEPAFGSDYRPSDIFGAPIPYANFPDQQQLGWEFKNTQFALALDGRFEGWDLSLYSARVLDSRFSIATTETERSYELINMAGFATNIVRGSWLLKSEAAFISNINYRSTDKKNRLDVLLGFDYMGFKNTTLSFELADRHIFDYEDHMLTLSLQEAKLLNTFPDFVRKDSVQVALRGSYTFDHDNATINYLLSMMGSNSFEFEDGGFQRLWISYKYSDPILLEAGIVDYIGGKNEIPFYNAIKDNDRVYAQLTYTF